MNSLGGTKGKRRQNKRTYKITPDGELVANGFSPAYYTGKVSAPGYVFRYINPDFSKGNVDLGIITLEKQRTIQIEYISAKENASFEEGSVMKASVRSGEYFKIAGRSYALFQLLQSNRKLMFRSGVLGLRYNELGPGKLEDFLGVDRPTENLAKRENDMVAVVSGHVYLAYDKPAKAHVLFRITYK